MELDDKIKCNRVNHERRYETKTESTTFCGKDCKTIAGMYIVRLEDTRLTKQVYEATKTVKGKKGDNMSHGQQKINVSWN